MIDLIERIGPFLGIAAFVGLAVLAFLIFQQAREVRRLREWAGRAPERASEASEAAGTAAEARGEAAEPEEKEPGRLALWWKELRERAEPRLRALDRRLPVDPRYLLAVGAAALIAVGVLTSGFGILGGDNGDASGVDGAGKERKQRQEEPQVAVLNATQIEANGTVIAGEPGLAGKVADQVVKPAGFEVGREDNADSGVEATVVMYDDDGDEEDARKLAEAVTELLGATETAPMIDEIRDRAGGAQLALVIGQDDADF